MHAPARARPASTRHAHQESRTFRKARAFPQCSTEVGRPGGAEDICVRCPCQVGPTGVVPVPLKRLLRFLAVCHLFMQTEEACTYRFTVLSCEKRHGTEFTVQYTATEISSAGGWESHGVRSMMYVVVFQAQVDFEANLCHHQCIQFWKPL